MKNFFLVVLAAALFFSSPLLAEITKGETDRQFLAKELVNPISSMVSLPLQVNLLSGLGNGSGTQNLYKFQPVVPAKINQDWVLIVRPIFSYINQLNVVGTSSQTGFGDTQLQLYFSPAKFESIDNGLMWGAGPIFIFPTASQASLGTEKWGIGPAAAAVRQNGPWTIGGLVDHIFSFTGSRSRSDFSLTFLQPFICYSGLRGTSFSLSSEMTYEWVTDRATIPLVISVSQIVPIGSQIFDFTLGGVYYLQSPTPINGWGGRFSLTLVLPNM
jgi:hypothetical protein